ncbi:MAG TPA: IS21-like element helper ATPase IstB [Bacteroidales bacterium]|nr:IS21-like element helper ATPase IstB [Bacteroidales bacterium]HYX06063.1 IS21-like element helper ATPase IstB [Bacteroidales bacterium]
MNQTATMQKLEEMRLSGFTRAYREILETGINKDFTIDEVISHLVQAEWDDRYNRRLQRLVTRARFRYQASMEQIDYAARRELDKGMMLRLSTCDWIKKKQNLIITGATGLGKSFLASAFGHQACQQGYKVFYRNSGKLFDELKIAKVDGSYIKEINKIEKQDLLIIDDFGLKPLDNNQRLILLELLEDRHGKRSTIITSQLPVNKWYDVIGEPTIADAILDRLVHSSHRIELNGDTLRKKYKND